MFLSECFKQNNLNNFAFLNALSMTTPHSYSTNVNRTNVFRIEVFYGAGFRSTSIILNYNKNIQSGVKVIEHYK